MALQDPDLSIWKIYANTRTLPPRIKVIPTLSPTNQYSRAAKAVLTCIQSNRISIHWELVIGEDPVCKPAACAGSMGNENTLQLPLT
jgi:hypothetical protein